MILIDGCPSSDYDRFILLQMIMIINDKISINEHISLCTY
jgi:hypothetical protein